MSKVVNLTPALLRRIILEERKKLSKPKKLAPRRKGMPSGKPDDL